jgi:hypothetical protein
MMYGDLLICPRNSYFLGGKDSTHTARLRKQYIWLYSYLAILFCFVLVAAKDDYTIFLEKKVVCCALAPHR